MNSILFAAMQAGVDPGDLSMIAWSQVIMAVAAVVILLLALGASLISYNTMRALGRLIKEMEVVTNRLAPRAEPLIDSLTKLTTDMATVTQSVRGEIDTMKITMADVNYRVRRAADEVEERMTRFGDVMKVVQDEAEELLMGAAATARGLHAAAEVLRDTPPTARRRRRIITEDDDDFE